MPKPQRCSASRAVSRRSAITQWVSVADLATPDDARNAVNALRAVNVTDAYVVADGGPGIVVSVGVFNDSEGAQQAAALVRRAGLEPRISDRTRRTEVTWLDVDRTANEGLPQLNDLGDAAPGARRQSKCAPARTRAKVTIATRGSTAGYSVGRAAVL